jgi:MFS family permease
MTARMAPRGRSRAAPRYRWVIAFAGALVLALSMGAIVNGLSAFVVPMQEAHGWSRADIAFINSAGIAGLAFGGIVMGRLADRFGERPVILFGAVALGSSYLLASATHSLPLLYAVFAAAGFFGAGAIFAPVLAAVGAWFRTGAGTAIGIAAAGQALGQGGVPFLSSLSIGAIGVQGTFAATGAVMLALMVPLALLFRSPPDAAGGTTDAEAQAGYPPVSLTIPVLCAAIILCCTCMSVPLMHLIPLIRDKGFTADEAGSVVLVMLAVAIIGRFFFGWLADRTGALPAYMTATLWMTATVYGFVALDSLRLFYPYAAFYGFGYAGVMTGVLVSIRALTPRARRGMALGTVTMFGWFGHAIGGWQGGFLFDLTGGYAAPYAVAVSAGALNLLLVFTFFRVLAARNRGGLAAE